MALVNDGLFEATRQLQKYGLKSMYVADQTPLPIADWHIYDPYTTLQGSSLENLGQPSRSLAHFQGFSSQLVDKIPVSYSLTTIPELEGSWALDYTGLIKGKPEQSAADIFFSLNRYGQLEHGPSSTPLAWFSQRLGLNRQYQILRARALSLYADMVLPAYLINDSDEIETAEQAVRNAHRAKTISFKHLVMARQRLIDSHPNLPALITKAEKASSRMVCRWEVVGFIRHLPKGQRASQQQRNLCWQDQGLELAASGETYVRAHSRGGGRSPETDISKSQMSRAQIRHIGGAVVGKCLDEES